MLPTRGFLFDLEGLTRDPCEAQFGAFACAPKSFLGHELPGYDLVYQEGCNSSCSFDSCTVGHRNMCQLHPNPTSIAPLSNPPHLTQPASP